MEAQLQVESGPGAGAVVVLEAGQTKTLGRGPGADLRLDDPALAPRHAAARLVEDGLQVVDLGGPGGTRLNGAPLVTRRPTDVESGDLLELGGHSLRVTVLGGRRRRRAALPFPAAEFTDVRRVGGGATGTVYRARWVPRGVDVALKLLRQEHGPGSQEYARFQREQSTVARLRCPFVVGVHDLRTTAEGAYLVMELIEGRPLDVRLAAGPLPVPDALRAVEDVARALDAAARAGVVHRDVKPANVLLDARAGVARLCDFGLAKDLQAQVQTLTAQGVGLGTLAYLPPEQVSAARSVGPPADVYALGATLHHALAGQPPFHITSEDALAVVLHATPPPLEGLRPETPPEVARLVLAMLAKGPAERPPASTVAAALAASRHARWPTWDPRSLFTAGVAP